MEQLSPEDARRRLSEALLALVNSGTDTVADDIRAACLVAGEEIARADRDAPYVMRSRQLAQRLLEQDRGSAHLDSFRAFLLGGDDVTGAAAKAGVAGSEEQPARADPRRPLDDQTRRFFDYIVSDTEIYEGFLAVALDWPQTVDVIDQGERIHDYARELAQHAEPGSDASAALSELAQVQWPWMPFLILHAYGEAADDQALLERLREEHERLQSQPPEAGTAGLFEDEIAASAARSLARADARIASTRAALRPLLDPEYEGRIAATEAALAAGRALADASLLELTGSALELEAFARQGFLDDAEDTIAALRRLADVLVLIRYTQSAADLELLPPLELRLELDD